METEVVAPWPSWTVLKLKGGAWEEPLNTEDKLSLLLFSLVCNGKFPLAHFNTLLNTDF